MCALRYATMQNESKLGRMLWLYRKARNVGVRAMANEIGMSFSALAKIERGGPFNYVTFKKLLDWMGR